MKNLPSLALGALALLAAGSCQKASPSTNPSNGSAGGATVTYYQDVKPIIDENCIGCHVTGGIAPFDLTTYDNVKAEAMLIEPNVQNRVMPPWMPSPTSLPLVNDRSLSDTEIQTLVNWVEQGAAEGNPSDPAVETIPTSSFTADQSLEPAAPYTPTTANGTDDYHCFVLNPNLATDEAVVGFNIIPGDHRVVHHVLLFSVPAADASQLTTLEAGGSDNGYTCFGGPQVNSADLVAGWVPGTEATMFPKGTGVVVKAGSILVMQVHYNLLVVQNTTDQTTAQLEYASSASVTDGTFYPIVNTTFDIPVGQIQTVTATLDTSKLGAPAGTPFYLWGVTPHMHLHGTQISVVVQATDGTTTTLVDVPQWQFQWQELYFFQSVQQRSVGDVFTLSCTFDNTAADQPYINGVQETPVPLTWGEDTLNEMCLSYIFYTTAPAM